MRKELETVVEFYEASIVEAGLQLSVEVPDNLFIRFQRTLFQRAVGNLFSNAIKQTPSQGLIRVTARNDVSHITLEISDTGKGVSEEHLPHLFERFYRVDPSRSKDSGGAGLGLAIVKSIAVLQGGSVSMQSKLGLGTTVSLQFPAEDRMPT